MRLAASPVPVSSSSDSLTISPSSSFAAGDSAAGSMSWEARGTLSQQWLSASRIQREPYRPARDRRGRVGVLLVVEQIPVHPNLGQSDVDHSVVTGADLGALTK